MQWFTSLSDRARLSIAFIFLAIVTLFIYGQAVGFELLDDWDDLK